LFKQKCKCPTFEIGPGIRPLIQHSKDCSDSPNKPTFGVKQYSLTSAPAAYVPREIRVMSDLEGEVAVNPEFAVGVDTFQDSTRTEFRPTGMGVWVKKQEWLLSKISDSRISPAEVFASVSKCEQCKIKPIRLTPLGKYPSAGYRLCDDCEYKRAHDHNATYAREKYRAKKGEVRSYQHGWKKATEEKAALKKKLGVQRLRKDCLSAVERAEKHRRYQREWLRRKQCKMSTS